MAIHNGLKFRKEIPAEVILTPQERWKIERTSLTALQQLLSEYENARRVINHSHVRQIRQGIHILKEGLYGTKLQTDEGSTYTGERSQDRYRATSYATTYTKRTT